MNRRLYVGNLNYAMTEAELAETFAQAGQVLNARIITDRETGKPRGFGFVEMATDTEADVAIRRFDGATVGGRKLTVNIAQDKPQGNGHGHRGRRGRRDDHRREARW